MISLGMHRIINEIEKKRVKGQILHFLSGDGIKDHYYYDVYYGVQNLLESIKIYYLLENDLYDYVIHLENSGQKINVFSKNADGSGIETIEYKDLFEAKAPTGPLKARPRRHRNNLSDDATNENPTDEQDDDKKKAEEAAQSAASSPDAIAARLGELLKKGDKRIILLLENMEWIAGLYGQQPDLTWIMGLQNWVKAKNFLAIVTIKDYALLKTYNFNEEETFVGLPGAEEIKYSYLRYILRNTDDYYKCDNKVLDDIAHSMSVGKKDLLSCMRILKHILSINNRELTISDFEEVFEKNIEERVSWEDVRLASDVKNRIEARIDAFIANNDKNPPMKGILFTGPPGTGKTMIAKALANEKQCYFMAPTLADLKGEYIGQSSAKVKRVFAEARANAPTIMFIDEADTVFPSRSTPLDRDSFGLDMVNQFLQEIDGAKTGKQKIFVVAATNRPEAVDGAIKSRLNTPVEIPLPNKEMRNLIFNDNLTSGGEEFTLDGKSFKEYVLEKSERMSGRDINNFVKQVKLIAGQENKKLCDDSETECIFRRVFESQERQFIREVADKGIFAAENIICPMDNKLREKDIIGYAPLKAEIKNQADYICADAVEKQSYDDFGIVPQKGILLYGPPGNGKTRLAQAIAGEYGFYFFKVISTDVCSASTAGTLKKLSDIFSEVIKFSNIMSNSKGIVLFFDEFDSLAGTNVLDPATRGAFLTYLSDTEGLRSKNSKILFMAATNYYGVIDEATKRTGRIDCHAFMDNPTEADGKEMLRYFFHSDSKIACNGVGEADPTVDPILDSMYDALREETKNNPEVLKRAIVNYRSNSWEEKNVKDIIDEIKNSIRPSGSDLESLYKTIKGLAFRHSSDFIENDRLVVKKELINMRFPGYATNVTKKRR